MTYEVKNVYPVWKYIFTNDARVLIFYKSFFLETIIKITMPGLKKIGPRVYNQDIDIFPLNLVANDNFIVMIILGNLSVATLFCFNHFQPWF